MKRIITLLAAFVMCSSLFAQAPYKIINGLDSKLIRPNIGKDLSAPAPTDEMLSRFNNEHPSTRGGAKSYWLNSVSAIDSFANYNFSTKPGYGADYMYSDSIVWIKYSNGTFRPFFYSLGDVFDPYAQMYKDYFSVHGGYVINTSWSYRVDSMAMLYYYKRYNNATSIIDTLQVTMMQDSGNNNILLYKYLAVHKNNSGTWANDTVHVNSIPTMRYNNLANREVGVGAQNYNVLLSINDTGFITKKWAVPNKPFYVPAGYQVATSISYKTGLAFKNGDTLNRKLNALRVYSENELGQDSLPVINDIGATGLNFSSTATRFNRFHEIHGQLDSLYLVAQIWNNALNFNHHYIYYHISVVPTGVNNITQTIKNVSIYPNPSASNTELTFDAKDAGHINVSLFDITGRLVSTVADYNTTTGAQQLAINTKNLTNGMYLVTITDATNTQITQKLMVNH